MSLRASQIVMSQTILQLNRVDFLQVGAVEYNCMKVLPLGTKETHQSLVVGDKNGTVTCLTVKKKITNVSYSISLSIIIYFNFHILLSTHI